MMIKKLLFFSLLLALITGFGSKPHKIKFYKIKNQSVNCYQLLGEDKKSKIEDVKTFEISDFITYRTYKIYLNAIKKDSTQAFYLSQLPDSSICLTKCYQTYLNSTKYDLHPVVGVNWDAAMNFCKWKTLQDNKGELEYIYRLPTTQEWLITNQLKGDRIDINLNYSDWLLTSKDESLFYNSNETIFPYYDYYFFHKQSDPIVLKRKVAIGNSFLFKQKRTKSFFKYSYYSENGYRHIAFRIVKKKIDKNTNSLINSILKFWGL